MNYLIKKTISLQIIKKKMKIKFYFIFLKFFQNLLGIRQHGWEKSEKPKEEFYLFLIQILLK